MCELTGWFTQQVPAMAGAGLGLKLGAENLILVSHGAGRNPESVVIMSVSRGLHYQQEVGVRSRE